MGWGGGRGVEEYEKMWGCLERGARDEGTES